MHQVRPEVCYLKQLAHPVPLSHRCKHACAQSQDDPVILAHSKPQGLSQHPSASHLERALHEGDDYLAGAVRSIVQVVVLRHGAVPAALAVPGFTSNTVTISVSLSIIIGWE